MLALRLVEPCSCRCTLLQDSNTPLGVVFLPRRETNPDVCCCLAGGP